MPDCVVLIRRLLGEPRVPRRAKIVLGLVLPYLAFPVDLVPDFIPVLGQLDDALVVATALTYVLRRAGPDVVAQHWPGSEAGLGALLRLAR